VCVYIPSMDESDTDGPAGWFDPETLRIVVQHPTELEDDNANDI